LIPKAASNFHKVHVGTGPQSVRELFRCARKYAPSIVFIDEIDLIGKAIEGDGSNLGTNYDVEDGKGGIGQIDEALSRRFDSKILVDLPNIEERKLLIQKSINKIVIHEITAYEVETLSVRSETYRMNPSNLVTTIAAAVRMAYKESITLNDKVLLEVIEVANGGEKKSLGGEYLERTARHESGHAIVYFLSGHIPTYLTVVARSGFGGYMEHSVKELKNPSPTKKDLLGKIRTSLGGYAAEFVCYNENDIDAGFSTGASGDLQNATNIVRDMLTKYGMYEDFGLAVGASDSDELAKRINDVLREQLRITKSLITENRIIFDNLVAALVEKEKLTEKKIEEILSGGETD
jgi:ATP-dependent Zn protease